MTLSHLPEQRQRFFINHSPIRGDIVHLNDAYHTIINKKNYPKALQALLGEMLVAASLLIGTLKIEGRLSIQLQSQHQDGALAWAMAECDHTGAVRALADYHDDGSWEFCQSSQDAFAQLGMAQGVLFINIAPAQGQAYQGIVERVSDDLGACLAHYQKQSAQIPTLLSLASNEHGASGILVQLLPQTADEKDLDPDLWDRLTMLTKTLKKEELLTLPADEILYRLYHEEDVVLPQPHALHFGCTCSVQKSQSAILQLGLTEALAMADNAGGHIALDCGFCGTVYDFDKAHIEHLFA
ncbi:MAG: Hsp33 family molecular chaperone HslO [Moraxella sp.]|nr:Hsp33 family molecular chaperone HslO [Moraxella sp.]